MTKIARCACGLIELGTGVIISTLAGKNHSREKCYPVTNLSSGAPTETNAHGGKGSAVGCRADLIDARALLHIGAILDVSSRKYGVGNWRKVTVQEHINHAMVHQLALLSGDGQDDHLGHAALRMLMALGVSLDTQPDDHFNDIEV